LAKGGIAFCLYSPDGNTGLTVWLQFVSAAGQCRGFELGWEFNPKSPKNKRI